MATNFQDILDQYSAGAAAQLDDYSTPFTPGPLPENIGTISDKRKKELARVAPAGPTKLDGIRAAVIGSDVSPTASEYERDMATMDATSLYTKYGDAAAAGMISERVSGRADLNEIAKQADRTGLQTLGDSGIDLARSFINTAGGIETLGGVAVDKLSGNRTALAPAFAKATTTADQFLKDRQSNELQTRRALTEIPAQAGREENARTRAADIANGDSSFVAGLKNIGRDILTGVKAALSDPEVALSESINAGGSMLAVGPLARAIRVPGEAGLKTAMRSGVISYENTLIPKIGERVTKILAGEEGRLSTIGAIGVMEGGSGAVSAANKVDALSYDDLNVHSQAFRDLVANGTSPEIAKRMIASDVTLQAGLFQGIVGGLTGRLVAPIEGNLVAGLAKTSLPRAVLKEGVEEGIQGASQPLIENASIAANADDRQTWDQGVGESLAQGAVYGSLSAGGLGAPFAAGRTAARGAKVVVDGVKATGGAIADAASNIMTAGANAFDNARQTVTDNLGAVPSAVSNLASRIVSKVGSASTFEQAVSAVKAKTAGVVDKIKQSGEATADNIASMVALARIAPEKIDPDAAEQILQHFKASEGTDAAPQQGDVTVLQLAQKIAKTAAAYQARVNELGRNAKAAPNVVTNQILVGEDGQKAPSALDHMKVITAAMQTGNTELAASTLTQLTALTQTLQNKVAALNTHYDGGNGDGKQTSGIKYENTTTKGKVLDALRPLWVNAQVPASVQLAQRIENDASAVHSIQQSLAQAYPELGIAPVQAVALDAALSGPVDDVVKYHRNPVQQAPAAPTIISGEVKPAPTLDTQAVETEKQFVAERVAQREAAAQVKSKADPVAQPQRESSANLSDPAPVEKTAAKVEPAVQDTPVKAEPTPVPVAQVEKAAAEIVPEKPKLKTLFGKAFVAPKAPNSRLFDNAAPIETISKALESADTLKAQTEGRAKGNMTPEIAENYKTLLSNSKGLITALGTQLRAYLDKTDSTGKTREAHILEGTQPARVTDDKQGRFKKGDLYDLLLTPNGKAANLLIEQDGKLIYDPSKVETAVLAALQWTMISGRYWAKPDNKQIAKILGVEEYQIDPGDARRVKAGMGSIEVKLSLANLIQQFWGMSVSASADQALVRGITEGMAAELMQAMIDNGALQVDTIKMRGADGKVTKTIDRFIPFRADPTDPIRAYPTAIEDAVLIETQSEYNIGEAPKNLSQTQMNNRRTRITREQSKAVRAESNTPYTLNQGLTQFVTGLGADNFLRLFGEADLEARIEKGEFNVVDAETLRGRNQTLQSSFDSIGRIVAQLDNHSNRSAPIYFAHAISQIGRMQQLGKDTPQSSKAVREVLLPTASTLDLTNLTSDQGRLYQLALAQMLGVKVHNYLMDGTGGVLDQLNAKLEALKSVTELLQKWQDKSSSRKPLQLTAKQVDEIKEAFGGEVTPMGFHALFDHARFLKASAEERKAFRTQIYIEADGVSNGPMNAMAMATHGRFTANQLEVLAKGGLFLAGSSQTMNQHRAQSDSQDVYKKTSMHLQDHIRSLISSFAGDQQMVGQMNNLLRLMLHFDPKNVMLKDDEKGDKQLEFDRGIAKNPLTITLYGSGAKGIAGNIANELLSKIYQAMSLAATRQTNGENVSAAEAIFGDMATPDHSADQIMGRFVKLINELTHSSISEVNKKEKLLGMSALTQNSKSPLRTTLDPKTFKLTSEEFDNLQKNVQYLFVGPLQDAIRDTVGPEVLESMDDIRDATNIQSVFMKQAFLDEIRKTMKKLGRTPGQFLSLQEQEEVFQRAIIRLKPFIDTGSQTFFPAGTDRMTDGDLQFGRSFGDRFQTDGSFEGIDKAGVGGIPMMIVGMGDGYMMQLASNMSDAVQGTLKIFDGVNMPLDKAVLGSQQVNEAAFEAMMNNPLSAVSKTFRGFVDAVQIGDLNEADRAEIADAVFNRQVPDNVAITNDLIRAKMNELAARIQQKALSIDARHNVMRRVNLSVDQMAAVGAPYVNEGSIDLSGMDPIDAQDVLNEEYHAELDKLTPKAEVTPIEPTFKALLDKVSVIAGTGIRRVSQTGLKRLLVGMNMPAAQKQILGEIVKALAAADYNILIGDHAAVDAYTKKNGHVRPNEGPGLQGYTSFTDKAIYVMSGTSETLVHELIHAATFERLMTHYEGKSLGLNSKEQVEAITRLETLMGQFMELGSDGTLPYDAVEAFANAKGVIRGYQGSNTARSKAAALNEFMAWALTNEKITAKLAETKAHPLVQLAQDVIKSIKSLIWGRKAAPAVADDMLSNLQFNTGILIRSEPTVQQRLMSGSLEHNTAYGNNERLAEMTDRFARVVASTLNVTHDPGVYISKVRAEAYARINARDSVNQFRARYSMTDQEAGLFEMVVTALGTEAQFNPNTISEISKLYDHVLKNVKVEDFLPEVSIDPSSERFLAQEKLALIRGDFNSNKDIAGRSTMMSSFLALSMISDDFRKVLSKIKPPQQQLAKWNSIDNILDNIGNASMLRLSELTSGAKRNVPDVQAAMEALQGVIESVAQERTDIITRTIEAGQSVLDRANKAAVDTMVFGSNTIINALDQVQGLAPTNKLVIGVTESLKVVASMVNEPRSMAIQNGFMSQAMKMKLPGPVFNLINEIVGRTSENANIYDLIKLVRAFVQQARQQFREDLPRVLNSKFTRELTKDEQTHLWKMARVDVASLMSTMNEQQVVDALENIGSMGTLITSAENAVQAIDAARWSGIQQKAKQLANFMVTKQVGNNLLKNADAIAHMLNEPEFQPGFNAAPALVEAIDQLTTLYALDQLADPTKDALSSLAQNEPEGLKFMLSYLKGQRNDEMTKITQPGLARFNHYKGYVPSEVKSGQGLVVMFDKDAAHLKAMGWVRVGDYVGSAHEPDLGNKSYWYSPVAVRGSFNQGILQNIRPTAGGVDPLTGYTNDAATSGGHIAAPQMVSRIQALSAQRGHVGAEPLLPVFGADGKVVAYERSIDPNQEARVERNTNLSEMIGAWRGRQVEELSSNEFNNRLLQELKSIHAEDAQKGRLDEYVNLFDKNLKDPIYKDAVSLISKEVRGQLEAVFGKDQFPVRKDMIDDVIGYRAASVGDSWTGISRWPIPVQNAFKKVAHLVFGEKAYQRLMQIEGFWHNFITDVRVTIVVKSVVVPMANLAANFLQLLARGVPLNVVVQGMPKKTAEVKAYTERRLRQIEIEAEVRAATGNSDLEHRLNRELQSIKDANRRMSIWPLIEAGEFAAISDTGVSREEIMLSEGRLSDYMEKLVSRLPDGVRTAGRYAIVSKETSLFKGMQLATEYGDFLGKAILYDHLVGRKKLSPKEALGVITEEFVNYDRLPGRFRGALERNGFIWFWHFKLRSMKIAASMIRNNPVHAALAMFVPTLFGMESPGAPVTDNALAVAFDPRRTSYSVGWDMAWTGYRLNPWWALLH